MSVPNLTNEMKVRKMNNEIKRLRTARNTLHLLENKGTLENNLSMEQIYAIRIAEFALDELCKSKDVPRSDWKGR